MDFDANTAQARGKGRKKTRKDRQSNNHPGHVVANQAAVNLFQKSGRSRLRDADRPRKPAWQFMAAECVGREHECQS